MEQKTYIGSGKTQKIKDGFVILKYALGPKDIETINNIARENNGWVNINIQERKTPSKKGHTHYGVLDTWKPSKGKTRFDNYPELTNQKDFNRFIPSDRPF